MQPVPPFRAKTKPCRRRAIPRARIQAKLAPPTKNNLTTCTRCHHRLTAALAFVAGTGFTLFGYVLNVFVVQNSPY